MPRDRFDGDDVIKVKRRIAEAVERARTTGEPTLVEVVTYRFRGHSMSDPGLYRTKDEVEEWKRRDPLNRSRARLTELGMSDDELGLLEEDVKAEIQDAVKFAEDSPQADEYFKYVVKE
jgi:pyruvate dehydrogenase E1 component alpha subunit